MGVVCIVGATGWVRYVRVVTTVCTVILVGKQMPCIRAGFTDNPFGTEPSEIYFWDNFFLYNWKKGLFQTSGHHPSHACFLGAQICFGNSRTPLERSNNC